MVNKTKIYQVYFPLCNRNGVAVSWDTVIPFPFFPSKEKLKEKVSKYITLHQSPTYLHDVHTQIKLSLYKDIQRQLDNIIEWKPKEEYLAREDNCIGIVVNDYGTYKIYLKIREPKNEPTK